MKPIRESKIRIVVPSEFPENNEILRIRTFFFFVLSPLTVRNYYIAMDPSYFQMYTIERYL